MRLRIGKRIVKEWQEALIKAGDREIGGVLFGQHIGDSDFRVIQASKQMRDGNQVRFRRNASRARREINQLSAQHGNDHEQFNYLGEWHSHPNAPVLPSATDESTMYQLLKNPDTGANFLLLLIIRLDQGGGIELSAHAYLASGHIIGCEIELEDSCDGN